MLFVVDIRNPCAVDNGGCSHVCFWSVLSQTGAQCHCPHGYSLMADTVTCFPTSEWHLSIILTKPHPLSLAVVLQTNTKYPNVKPNSVASIAKVTCMYVAVVLRRESTTPTTTCAADQFACAGGSCVPSVWLCDTVSDCPLGDDESQAMCGRWHDLRDLADNCQ